MATASLVLVPLDDGLPAPVPLPASGHVTIGRKTSCQLVVPDAHAYVSGEHCRVRTTAKPSVASVEDLSANGTFLNGQRIGKGKTLPASIGDELSLAKPGRKGGALRFKFAEGPPLPAKAAVNVKEPPLSLSASASAKEQPPPSAPKEQSVPPSANPVPTPEGQGQAEIAQSWNAAPAAALRPTTSTIAADENPADVASEDSELLAQLRSRCAEESACVEALARRLQEIRQDHGEQRAQLDIGADAIARANSAAALVRSNARVAEECEELRARMAKQREASSELELACPEAEGAVAQKRLRCSQLREELQSEQDCVRQGEQEASALRLEVEELTTRERALRSELVESAARNASLEQACAEAEAESERARVATQAVRRRLGASTSSGATLRGAVRNHTESLRSRLLELEQALLQVEGADTETAARALEAEERGGRQQAPREDGDHRSRAGAFAETEGRRPGSEAIHEDLRGPVGTSVVDDNQGRSQGCAIDPDIGLCADPEDAQGSAKCTDQQQGTSKRRKLRDEPGAK